MPDSKYYVAFNKTAVTSKPWLQFRIILTLTLWRLLRTIECRRMDCRSTVSVVLILLGINGVTIVFFWNFDCNTTKLFTFFSHMNVYKFRNNCSNLSSVAVVSHSILVSIPKKVSKETYEHCKLLQVFFVLFSLLFFKCNHHILVRTHARWHCC